jgi:hypothetical protein
MTTDRTRWKRSVLLAAWLSPCLSLVPGADNLRLILWQGTGQALHHKASKPQGAPARVKELSVPFHVGETLNYRVSWAAFPNAASLQLSVPEQRELFGWQTWHFRASAHTQSPVRSLFAIDDEFDSYTDARTFGCRQYEMYLNEMGRKENEIEHLVPLGESSRAPAPDVVVLPGTRDPVGALYALRTVDWQLTPQFQVPVYDGHDVYQVSAQRQTPSETVTVAAGQFSASRIFIRLFQNSREVSHLSVTIWLANNRSRTPVQIQAELPFGDIRTELTSGAE